MVHRRSIISLIICLAASDQAYAQLPPPPLPGGSAGYTVAYTSPNAQWTTTAWGSQVGTSGPYGPMGSCYGAWAPTGGSAWSMLPGTSSCHGEITATFTWNNGGDQSKTPPPGVVVKESCCASWSGELGACDNGLGHQVVAGPTSGSASGDRYRFIAAPGPSFSVTCSPSSNASVSISWMVGGCSTVSYSAAALPVDISLTGGAMVNGMQSYLVGKMCKADLVSPAETPPVVIGGVTPCWSISGGEPFGGWSAHRASATMVPLGPMAGQVWVSCFYRKAGETPILQVSGQLAIPSGATTAGSLQFTVSKQMATVSPAKELHVARRAGVEPEFQAPGWPANGVALWPLTGTPSKLDFGGILDPVYGYPPVGIRFKSWVTTPPEFGSGFGWNYVQTTSISRTHSIWRDGSYHTESVATSGLDFHYPYVPTPFMDEAGADAPGKFLCNGQVETGADEPYSELKDLRPVSLSDTFSMYVMYCPPSPDVSHPSAYVPLGRCDWAWSGSAAIVGGAWTFISGSSTNTEFGPSGHPTWSNIVQPPLPWQEVP